MIACNWQLVVCGINHKTSSLEQREPLQLGRDDMARANALFCDLRGVKESVIVSTCNRIEFYMVADCDHKPFDIVAAFYHQFRCLDMANLESHFYMRHDKHAASHLFRVSAGIDSMVVGESQILGQIKEAYSSACAVKAAGKVLHGLFHQAFRIGKQVRSDTELGKGACSVSTATIEMLKAKLDDLSDPVILFIGINPMISLSADRLKRRGFNRFLFANRTAGKAVEFALRYNAAGYPLDRLPELLEKADVVISCTGSNLPIINDEIISPVAAARPGRKLVIADMAMPRDVELTRDYPGIEYYDLESVKRHVEGRQSRREDSIPEVETIIDRKLEQFMFWFDHVRHEPIYNGLGETFEKIRHQEMERVLEMLPEETRDAVDRATRRVVDRLLQINARTSATPETSEHS